MLKVYFELIKNGMIPGKHLGLAMDVVNKLKSQYQLLNRKEAIIKKKTKSKDDVVKLYGVPDSISTQYNFLGREIKNVNVLNYDGIKFVVFGDKIRQIIVE